MEELARYLLQLESSERSDELFNRIDSLLQTQSEQTLSSFIEQYFDFYLGLQKWIWQSFEKPLHIPSYIKMIMTSASLIKRLIFHYDDRVSPERKAALIFIPSTEQIKRIFDQVDQCEDDNDSFISAVSTTFENFAYFLHDNPMWHRSELINYLDDSVVERFIVNKRYKMYLGQLRQEHPPPSIFTNRFSFYIRTCSFYCYSHITVKAQTNLGNVDDLIRFLADDYLAIVHIHSYHVSSWSQELLGCMAQLIGLVCGCFWWGGVTQNHVPILFPNEQVVCNHIEDLIRMIGYKPFYQQTKLARSNDITALMDSLVLLTILIVQTQNINWFFRSNDHIRNVIISVASASLNDEIGLCSYAILGEVLSDEQLKDLRIDERICVFFFGMIESAWRAATRTYRHVPILYILKSFQALSKNDCIQQLTATLNKIMLFIEISDEYPIAYDIIWALSFNNDIATQLRSKPDFIAKISALGLNCTDELLKKVTNGILWNLQSHVGDDHDTDQSTAKKDNFDIMISYSHKDKQLCRQLYDELIKQGYRIWIDFDQMHGNVMDAMAQAIDQSQMVIICMSEDYRRSNYCRAEAQYAFQRQRKMVPVLFQKHYKPDGWLSFLLGTLLYVDFTKHEFPKAMEMLSKELVGNEKKSVEISTVKVVSKVVESKNMYEWAKEPVAEWLMKENLPQMSKLLKDCDGRSLWYLNHYLKYSDLKLVLKSLNEDAIQRTGHQLSFIELARFQSLMSEAKRSS